MTKKFISIIYIKRVKNEFGLLESMNFKDLDKKSGASQFNVLNVCWVSIKFMKQFLN